jgi:hypothetical protein
MPHLTTTTPLKESAKTNLNFSEYWPLKIDENYLGMAINLV